MHERWGNSERPDSPEGKINYESGLPGGWTHPKGQKFLQGDPLGGGASGECFGGGSQALRK